MIAYVDFETYYAKDFSLGKMTTEEYIRDKRFEVIGVGVAYDDAPAKWYSYSDGRKYFDVLSPLNHCAVVAHNAMFDAAILNWQFDVKPKLIFDTLSMAKPFHATNVGGSLRALADYYQIGQKGTEILDALGKNLIDFSLDELEAYGRYCKNDVELTRDLFNILRTKLPKNELMLIDRTIRMFTEPRLELDTALLRNNLLEIKAKKQELVDSSPLTKTQLMSNKQLAEWLEERGVPVPTKVSLRTGKETPAFGKNDEGFTCLANYDDPDVRAAVTARIAVKSTQEETRAERFIGIGERGKFPIPLAYCGATQTWRWSGTDKSNLQNLGRGSPLRKAIIAPKGYKLVVADSSNIELRINHTLAVQQDTMDLLAQGADLYKDFASKLYSKPVDEVTKDERFVGKVAHLSLGYGCGWRKFKEMCRIYGRDISDEEAENIVSIWRSSYGAIPQMWAKCQKAIVSMVRGDAFEVDDWRLLTTGQNHLKTPPNRFLQYAGLRPDDDGFTYETKKNRKIERVKLYGGKLLENICQHLARNIIGEQWLEVDKRYPVVLQVHDELVAVVPEDEAEEALEFMLQVMKTSPAWWPELVLNAEGDIGDSYGDAK